jgi:hypothetical protein
MEPVTAAALESAQAELRQRGGDLVVVADGPTSSFRTLEAAIRSLSPGFRARRGLAQSSSRLTLEPSDPSM